MNPELLSRVEDAGLNASAPPQQLWLDGWLVRFCPGKAKRARCINAVAAGRAPLVDKLRRAEAIYREAELPLVVRITPFTVPADLDAALEAEGLQPMDDTRVMVAPLPELKDVPPLPPGCLLLPTDAGTYAETVGEMRGSPMPQRHAHAQRLVLSPVPYEGWVLVRDGEALACGQFAREGDVVGLYDVFTTPQARGQGLATTLCGHLLLSAAQQGAEVAYLQVDAANATARSVYRRLGFSDAYAYHYRTADPSAA